MSLSFIDVFAGAGGLSLGLVQAGWKPLLAIDHWDDAVQTYEHNFSSHPILDIDISEPTDRQLRRKIPRRPDWVVGGPPCQGFSTVGKREKRDPRNLLVREFARIVAIAKPNGVLIENVLGLRDMKFVDFVCTLLGDLGYHLTPVVLAAADYGVPQLRRRIFFVGTRERLRFVPPAPTRRPASYVTVWDAIGDLPELLPGESVTTYDKRPSTAFQRKLRRGSKTLQGHDASRHPKHLVKAISFIPDGGNRRQIPDRYQPQSGYHNSYSRLHSGSPAVAVTQNMGKPSGTRCIHPFQHRGLTAREGARLQSFPDTFHFLGGVTSQRLQIANAVAPILAGQIAKCLMTSKHWVDSLALREAPAVTYRSNRRPSIAL